MVLVDESPGLNSGNRDSQAQDQPSESCGVGPEGKTHPNSKPDNNGQFPICHTHILLFNSLPNNKIIDWSKLKAFADDIINVNKNLKFVLGRIENIVGKGENDGYQHFLLFPSMFSKVFLLRVLKSGDYVVKI